MSVVAIVGRPNVGKSTLFNRIIGKRQALVSDMPGVTRDRHYGYAEHRGTHFTLIDTGGLSFDKTDAVESKMHKQAVVAVEEASVIICLFDGRDGIVALDREIVDIFRKSDKKVVYAVNKIDSEVNDALSAEFASLGLETISISAEHGRNIEELLTEVAELLPKEGAFVQARDGLKIALVGRPNVGKSTIINRLANQERVVVHEVAGTTRDTINVEVVYNGKSYVFVDTAGVKKRAKTKAALDKFATIKSLRAVEDADITFVVFDAEEGFTRQDITLLAYSFNRYKPTAILINKWDIATDPLNKEPLKSNISKKAFLENFRYNLKELHNIPILCISGKTGENCKDVFTFAQKLVRSGEKRVKTAELNNLLRDLVQNHPPPDSKGKQIKLNYITQADVNPPVFVVFTNKPEGVKKSYKKYVTNGLRKLLGEFYIPIVVKFRAK